MATTEAPLFPSLPPLSGPSFSLRHPHNLSCTKAASAEERYSGNGGGMAGGGRRRGGEAARNGQMARDGERNGTEEEAGEGRTLKGEGGRRKSLHSRPSSLSPRFFFSHRAKKSTKKTCFAFSSRVEGGGAVGDGLCNARSLLAAPPCFVQIFQGHGISGGRERRRAKKAGVYTLQRGRLANSAATSGAATKKHEHTHIIREARQSLLCVAPPPMPIAL